MTNSKYVSHLKSDSSTNFFRDTIKKERASELTKKTIFSEIDEVQEPSLLYKSKSVKALFEIYQNKDKEDKDNGG